MVDNDESPEGLQGLQGLFSEFYVQIISRFIPGSIFFLFYLNEGSSKDTGFFAITIFLCIVWLCGTALDKAGYGVLIFVSYLASKRQVVCDWLKIRIDHRPHISKILKWLKDQLPHLSKILKWLKDQLPHLSKILKWLTDHHPHLSRQPKAEQRQIIISVCDKIMFRSVGVICLLIWLRRPPYWPFAFDYNSPSPFLLFHLGRFLGFIGLAICCIGWVALQAILIAEEAKKKTEAIDKAKAEKKAEAENPERGQHHALKQLVAMQGVLYADVLKPETPPREREQFVLAWDKLEERKRIMKGNPPSQI